MWRPARRPSRQRPCRSSDSITMRPSVSTWHVAREPIGLARSSLRNGVRGARIGWVAVLLMN